MAPGGRRDSAAAQLLPRDRVLSKVHRPHCMPCACCHVGHVLKFMGGVNVSAALAPGLSRWRSWGIFDRLAAMALPFRRAHGCWRTNQVCCFGQGPGQRTEEPFPLILPAGRRRGKERMRVERFDGKKGEGGEIIR